jgi:hypothetical protein
MSSEPALPVFPPAWRSVSLGMKCLAAGAALLFAAMVLLPILLAIQFHLMTEQYAAQEIRSRGMPDLGVLAGLFVLLAGYLAWLAGLCLCALAPAEAAARPMALAALACWLLGGIALGQTSVATAVGFTTIAPREAEIGQPHHVRPVNEIGFGAAACLLVLASGMLSSCFVCSVAHHYHNAALTAAIHKLILFQLGGTAFVVLIGFLYLIATATWRDAGPWLGAPFAFLAIATVGVGCSWFLRIVKQTRAMLDVAEANAQPLT